MEAHGKLGNFTYYQWCGTKAQLCCWGSPLQLLMCGKVGATGYLKSFGYCWRSIIYFWKTLKLLKDFSKAVTAWDWKFPKSELKVGSNDHVINNLEHDWENVNEPCVWREILNQKRAENNINAQSCNKFSSDIRFP